MQDLEYGTYWNKAVRVITPGNNGIPEGIRQREKGSQMTVELPPDWHKNNEFLGFSVYYVCIPLAPGWLNCKLNFCGDGSGCWEVDDFGFLCCQVCVGLKEIMCVAYYPKLAIEKHYWSNKCRRLKASFHGRDNLPVEVKECGFHLIYTQNIPVDTENNDDQLMIEYNDEQRSCDTSTSSAVEAEDVSAIAQTNYHHTQFTERNHPSMYTTTQNINYNVVDAQDDEEEDHTHNWLELLCNVVQWICGRRY